MLLNSIFRFIHVGAGKSVSVLLFSIILYAISSLYMYGHLSCFWHLALMNAATLSNLGEFLYGHLFLFPLAKYVGMGLLGC